MKARLKFSKGGVMKFVGHLDLLRFFQKAFRRCELDMAYSQGFNPHQVMSFAAPLGVGLTSDGEYLDMELHSADTEEAMLQRINGAMNEDIKVLSFQQLPEAAKNAMSAVAAADYLVSLKNGYPLVPAFKTRLEEFLSQDSIAVTKKTKRSTQEVDIRPFILLYEPEASGFQRRGGCVPKESVAVHYENDNQFYIRLETGSARNLKPSLVLDAFYQYLGMEHVEFSHQLHRLEIYEEREGAFLPLGRRA